MRPHFEAINPHYFEMSEEELIVEVFGNRHPSEICHKFRLSLWKDYNRVRNTPGLQMFSRNICSGVCTSHYFKKALALHPGKLAYIALEPKEHILDVQTILNTSTPEIMRIMQLPDQINQKTGMIDVSLLALKFKIFQHMEARAHGTIVQKFKHEVDQKNLNLNADLTPNSVPDIHQFNSLEEIEAKIRELEKPRVKELTPARDVLPVQYIDIPKGNGLQTVETPEFLNHNRPMKASVEND